MTPPPSESGAAPMTRCAHPGCKCNARPQQRFCSDHCAKSGTASTGASCGCGHTGCN